MQFIKRVPHIDFMSSAPYAILVSAILILIGVISLIVHGGPKYGIDFAGGTLVQVRFAQKVQTEQIRQALKVVNIGGTIQHFGAEGVGEYLIRIPTTPSLTDLSRILEEGFAKAFGSGACELRRIEMVGPKVGKDLRKKGLQAILFSLVGILLYVSIRFKFRFAVGAVVALIHDVMITIGIFSLSNREFSLPVLAALLTIVGYSLNDTIVVYDRIRENMGKMKREPFAKTVNVSINETLSRTILTSFTTLIVVIVLFIFGGGVIHDFAFALLVGITVGTYSSIFIASPLVVYWEKRFPSKKGKP